MSKRVLIADDDHFYRKMLISVFDKSNYEIVTVLDGNDAVKFLSVGMFDIAIIDYHLPGKRGDEIMEIMRNKYLEVPVIIVTADDSIETERKVRSYGPTYFFIKPFNIDDMRKVVQKILYRKEKNYS